MQFIGARLVLLTVGFVANIAAWFAIGHLIQVAAG